MTVTEVGTEFTESGVPLVLSGLCVLRGYILCVLRGCRQPSSAVGP